MERFTFTVINFETRSLLHEKNLKDNRQAKSQRTIMENLCSTLLPPTINLYKDFKFVDVIYDGRLKTSWT